MHLMLDLGNGIFKALVFVLYIASLACCQLCYDPNGKVLEHFGICNIDDNASSCCAVNDQCWSNNLCATKNGTFYRGGCVSESYSSATCPGFCKTGMLDSIRLCSYCIDISLRYSILAAWCCALKERNSHSN